MCNRCSRRQFLLSFGALLALPALSGCKEETGPVKVRWGREFCAFCGMIVDDPRFAGQIRGGPKRKVWLFDDFGDGVLWLSQQDFRDDPATEFWVGDSRTGQWLDAKKAFYLSGQKSPMAHNFGAIALREEGALTYDEMAALVLERGAANLCITPTNSPLRAGGSF